MITNNYPIDNISIASHLSKYSVEFIPTLNSLIECIKSKNNKFVFIIDSKIITLYPECCAVLKNISPILPFHATEEKKNIDGMLEVLTFMQEHKLDKKSELIVIGGGITQDVSALAAHLYYRGIKYTLIPTTLLSMADSCIGAKSGLNFNSYKNQLGAFCAPNTVYICPTFLDTLTTFDMYSGYGEIIKLFIIANSINKLDPKTDLLSLKPSRSKLLSHIHSALTIKKSFIEQDEFDQGVRKILNYGHTFGHAIELLTNYKVPHGLAVVLGIDIENYIAMSENMLSEKKFLALHTFLLNLINWEDLKIHLTASALTDAVKYDKKFESNHITMLLLTDHGDVVAKNMTFDVKLARLLSEYLTTFGSHLNNTLEPLQ